MFLYYSEANEKGGRDIHK